MHAIEFETTPHQHTIRLPDSVPDGVPLRVLLLSQTPLAKPVERNLKVLLASISAMDIDDAEDMEMAKVCFLVKQQVKKGNKIIRDALNSDCLCDFWLL